MSVRSEAKVVVVYDHKILVNQCETQSGRVYYDLPGGGQQFCEPLEQAAIREVLEETGYQVKIVRFLALAEEIYEDPAVRAQYPAYAHRVLHIYLAHLACPERCAPTEMDFEQRQTVWLPLEQLDHVTLNPEQLNGKIVGLINSAVPRDLGCRRIG